MTNPAEQLKGRVESTDESEETDDDISSDRAIKPRKTVGRETEEFAARVNACLGGDTSSVVHDVNASEIDETHGNSDSFGLSETPTGIMNFLKLNDAPRDPVVSAVCDYLNETYPSRFAIKAPKLLNSEPVLARSRNKADLMAKAMGFFLKDRLKSVKIETGKDWYDNVVAPRLYDGGTIPLETIARLFFGENYAKSLDTAFQEAAIKLLTRMVKDDEEGYRMANSNDGNNKGVFLELMAGSNMDISKRLGRAHKRLRAFEHIERELTGRDRPRKREIRNHIAHFANITMAEIEGVPNQKKGKGIGALDYASGFEYLASMVDGADIHGIEADLCSEPADFLRNTDLKPQSVDKITLILGPDRLSDNDKAMTNIRILAREDGSTLLLMGFYLPINNVTDSKSKRKLVSKLSFWDDKSDIRARWMSAEKRKKLKGNPHLSDDLPSSEIFEALGKGEQEAVLLADLIDTYDSRYGMKAESVGVVPYEVYSPNGVVETPADLRNNYDRDDLKCGVVAIDRYIDNIFDNPDDSDNDLLVLPERIRLLLVAFRVKPLNLSDYQEPEKPAK